MVLMLTILALVGYFGMDLIDVLDDKKKKKEEEQD